MFAQGLAEILRTLVRHDVEFIVVGGMAAALLGAPVVTQDLDVVHARTPENIGRLLNALAELEAIYRTDPIRKISPDASHLEGPGHQLLKTRFGVLDVLGTIDDDATYADLVDETMLAEVAGVEVRILSLERLIRIKEKLDRPKDKAMLLVLRATLEERDRKR